MALIGGLLTNFLGLWLSSELVRGFTLEGGWKGFTVTAVVLLILNLLIKPVLRFLTFPLILLTLGLFGLVINGVILSLAARFTPYLTIESFGALVWSTIIITVVNLILHRFTK